ncbi:MAG TPA: nitrilase-related carbon-nitrogen hydrolase, partial [Candidatus Lustribacter sp.]|nr:nitrilase-related carbon-nitrogen hydrolase [Candidatus Lustribacter sp.]
HAGSIVERPTSAETGPEGKSLWNTSLVFSADGRLVTTYRKIHRFGFGAGEPVLMEAGERVVMVDLPDADPDDVGGSRSVRAGLSTCYDLRFPELFRLQVDRGAQILLMCSCWPLARVEHWRLLGRARALENQCFLLACNTAGTHGGVTMGGRSQVVGPDGVVLAEGGLDEEVLSVEVDVGAVARYRATFPVLADRRPFT